MKKQLNYCIVALFVLLVVFCITKKSNALVVGAFFGASYSPQSYCGDSRFTDPPQCKLSPSSAKACDETLDFVDYGSCVNGLKRKEISPNANCYPSNTSVVISCQMPKRLCTADDYTYSDWWSDCTDGVRTRNYKLIGDCSGGVGPEISKVCPKTCTSFRYSDWGSCINGQQTRTIRISYPLNCVDGQPILSQSCANTANITQTEIMADNEKIEEQINSATNKTIKKENSVVVKDDDQPTNKLKGKILIQVESVGEAWYINPNTGKRIYMANGDKAYSIMRRLGIGITNKDLDKIKTNSTFAKKNSGKIFLQVESKGEAYYIDFDGVARYLKNGASAFEIMKNLGLGITNNNLNKITEEEI